MSDEEDDKPIEATATVSLKGGRMKHGYASGDECVKLKPGTPELEIEVFADAHNKQVTVRYTVDGVEVPHDVYMAVVSTINARDTQ